MKFTALCFVALLAFVSASATTMETLAEINAHPLGQSLLLSIRANVDAGSNVDEVSDFLHKMLSRANKFSNRLDEDYKAEKGGLEIDIKAEKRLIDDFKKIIQKLKDSIKADQDESDSKTIRLNNVRTQLNQTREHLNKVEAEHARVAPILKKDVDAAIEAEAACKEAIAHMETYQTAISTSLLEVASGAESMLKMFSKELERLKPHLLNKNVEASALVHELIALTAAPKESKPEKVLRLLRELLKIIQDEVTDSKAAKAGEQETYENTRDQLKSDIRTFESQEATLVARLAVLAKRIKANTEELTIQNQNLKDAEETLEELQKRLAKVVAAYKYNREKTDKEVALMKKLIKAFDSDVKNVSSYAKQATNTGNGVPKSA